MIIGIDASRANLKNKTGTEWYSFYLIQELKSIIPQSYKVILYSKEALQDGLEKLPNNWESKILKWSPKFLWTQCRMSLEMFFKRPDVLFVPAHTIPLLHPKKTILVIHDIGFAKRKELYNNKELGYHNWAMKYAIKNAHHMITISNFSKSEIINYYKYPKDKISVVYNGFDSSEYYKIRSTNKNITDISPIQSEVLLKEYNIKDPYILFVGRLEQKKNIPRLIKAFKILKEKYKIKHKLVLIGSPGFKYEEVKTNISKFGLENDVIEPGYVEQKHMNVFMNFADTFVLPSLYEGFGIPILEAMSAGTPVACSDIEPLQEVGGEAAIYFDAQNEIDMADKISKIISNEDLKNKLIAAGLEQIKKFSYKKCANQTWEVIKNNI